MTFQNALYVAQILFSLGLILLIRLRPAVRK